MGCTNSKEVTSSVATNNAPAEAPLNAPNNPAQAATTATPSRTSNTSPISPATSSAKVTITPEIGFVCKTKSLDSKTENDKDKIFINIFHYSSITKTNYLSQDIKTVTDKKGESCRAYSVVIGTADMQKCLQDDVFKVETIRKVIDFLNKTYPNANLDKLQVKTPKMKKGYVGDDIPTFQIDAKSEKRRESLGILNLFTQKPATSPLASPPKPPTAEERLSISQLSSANNTPTPPKQETTSNGTATPPVVEKVNKPSEETKSTHAEVKTEVVKVEEKKEEKPSSKPSTAEETKQSDEKILAVLTLPPPPPMQGWLKKRGHIVQNWKMRYFILNHGFLTYYVDSLNYPPYGKDMKGQLCLAGYREKSVIEEGEVIEGKKQSVETSAVNSNNVFRIHLVFQGGIVDDEALNQLYSKQGTKISANSDAPKNGELLMETTSMEDKLAWLAAIEQHTHYIETLAMEYKREIERNMLQAIMFQADAEKQKKTNTENNTSDNNNTENPDGQPNEIDVLTSGNDSKPRSWSITSWTSNASRRSSSTPGNAAGQPQRRMSKAARKASIVLSAQKWSAYLGRNEKMILVGQCGKPNPLGVQYMREVVLISKEPDDNTTDGDGGDKSPTILSSNNTSSKALKRVIYIDSNTYEQKGQIVWEKDPYPTLIEGEGFFEIVDNANGKKKSRFYPKDDLTPSQWIETINSIPPK